MITYLQGDLFSQIPQDRNILIPHVCNCVGAWGAGFVIPLGKHFPKAKEAYKELPLAEYGDHYLGYTDIVKVSDNVFVANMIAQTLGGERPIRYDALFQCMLDVKNFTIHNNPIEIYAPEFGSGLAGGNKQFIEVMILDTWCKNGIPVTIFQYTPPVVQNSAWLDDLLSDSNIMETNKCIQ